MTTIAPAPRLDIRRGVDRSRTELAWLDSKHSFSFGLGDDPSNVHHGVLLVNNDDTVRAGTGFGTHPHQDMEIVTWVLTGSLVHQDSEGHSGVVAPHEAGITPSYEQIEVDDELLSGGLVPVASGMAKHDGERAIGIENRHAALHVAHLQVGESVELPDARLLHLFVAEGAVTLEGAGPLTTGDAVRFSGAGGHRVEATEAAAELLVWEMHVDQR